MTQRCMFSLCGCAGVVMRAVLSPLADPNLPIVDVIVAKKDCSKLAVERNRARRRIEAATREVFPAHACRGVARGVAVCAVVEWGRYWVSAFRCQWRPCSRMSD